MKGVFHLTNNLTELMATDVITVTPDQSIQEAAILMKQHDIGSIPVIENKKLVGIITDRDITLRSTAEGKDTHIPIAQCMSTNLTVANPKTDINEAAAIMAEHQIRRLPIVDNGELVGIVAIGDLAIHTDLIDEAGVALSEISEHHHHS
ncbi:CBS domain-containing protein [Bacillus suaedae]|uniref:CBS domain-containing protein n=1 Tax=Halalkalibacter suaedae TaxID=2822140 RepID=A0A940WXX9_9BACI|nr:CBS domain-containing protein [Bacillus suaedae]MBP3950391.1 CBS domain-containing protein [Bacillus suaedae]